MAEQIHLERGAEPWVPSPESEHVVTLNYWNVPTAGVIRQPGGLFEFRCLAGALDEWSLWVYRETYDSLVIDLLQGKKERHPWSESSFMPVSAVALAHEAQGIVDFDLLTNADLINQVMASLMAEKQVPPRVQEELWEEILSAA
jgi:hypothetical protein